MSTNDKDASIPWTRAGEDAFAALDELQKGITPQSSTSSIPSQDKSSDGAPDIPAQAAASGSASNQAEDDDGHETLEGPSLSFIPSPGLPAIPYRPSQSSLGTPFYTDADVQTLSRQNSRTLAELHQQRINPSETELLTNIVNSPYERAASFPPDRFNPFQSSPSPEKQHTPKPIPSTSHIVDQEYNDQIEAQGTPIPNYGDPREVFPDYPASEQSSSPSVEYVQQQDYSRSPSVEYVDNAFVQQEEEEEEEDDLPSPGSSPPHDYEERFISMCTGTCLADLILGWSAELYLQHLFDCLQPIAIKPYLHSQIQILSTLISTIMHSRLPGQERTQIPNLTLIAHFRLLDERLPADRLNLRTVQTQMEAVLYQTYRRTIKTQIMGACLHLLHCCIAILPLPKPKKSKKKKRTDSSKASKGQSRNSSAASLPKRIHPGYERASRKTSILKREARRSRDLSDLASELSIVAEEKKEEEQEDEDESDSDGVFDEEDGAGKTGRKRRHAPAAKSKDTKPRKRSARLPREDSVFDDEYKEAQQERIRYFEEVDKYELETESVKLNYKARKTSFLASFMVLLQ